ncbi:MAG: DMT family transporter [Chloroflexota bacterium]|nr:DMT family transporter [Chloroflexota bacterium]
MSASELSLLFGLAAMWGASFMFIKVAVVEMSPLMLVSIRLALAAFTLLLVQRALGAARSKRISSAPMRELWRPYLWVAIVNAIIPYTLIAWGEKYIASGTASILNASTPLFTALLASMGASYARSPERLTPARVAGLLVGFAGVAVLVAGTGANVEIGTGRSALMGQVAVLVASLAYGVGGLYARERFAGIPPILPATWQSAFGAVVLLPFALVLTPLRDIPSWQAVGSVAALGIVGTALALLLYYELLARVGATRTVMVTYLLPVMALIYGAVFLDESVGVYSLLGLALVLGGIAITARAKPRERIVPQTAAGR